LFKVVEGIEIVIGPKDFKKFGLADPKRDPNMADLMLSAKKAMRSPTQSQERSCHAENRHDQGHARFQSVPAGHAREFRGVGRGHQSGSTLGTIHNADVAPQWRRCSA